jgi:hypothetical protein
MRYDRDIMMSRTQIAFDAETHRPANPPAAFDLGASAGA